MGMNDRAKRNSIFTLRAFVARNAQCLCAAGNGEQIGKRKFGLAFCNRT